MKKIIIFVITTIFLFANFACAQKTQFKVKYIPEEYLPSKTQERLKLNTGSIDLTSYLPKGFSKKGDVDYTEYIQKGINENKKVVLPDFPVLINDSGLNIPSNRIIAFKDKSILMLKSSSKEKYEILRVHNASNIEIINPNIEGDRDTHTGTKGEWGMGIAIRGSSKNIKIKNGRISNCWGDGIYLGHLKHNAPENVLIENVVVNNCRRNGISITTGKNVKINNVVLANINGTKPECGLVIEPSAKTAVFESILVTNLITFNNKEAGFQIGGFEKLLGNSKSVSDIKVVNHFDDGSNRGIFVGRIRGKDKVKGENLKGTFVLENPKWINSRLEPFVFRKQNRRGPKIILKNLPTTMKNQIVNQSDIEL